MSDAMFVACALPVKTIIVINVAQAPFCAGFVLTDQPAVRVELLGVEWRKESEELGVGFRNANPGLVAAGRADVIGAEQLGEFRPRHCAAGRRLRAR